MTDDELIARARSGDAEARRALVDKASLRVARAVIGESAKERFELLRELVRGDNPVPGLGILLAGIARDEDADVKRAVELVYRAGRDRWGAPERDAVGRFAEQHGARLGAELALELVEWASNYPTDVTPFVRGAAAALRDVRNNAFTQLAWRTGFEMFVMRDRELVLQWSAEPHAARAVAKALVEAHARERGSCVPALDAIWTATARRDVWARALAEATSQNCGMSGRDEIAAWGWRRFCEHADERRDLYAAFRPWRAEWIDLRNATLKHARPGAESAVAHLRLWAGLDVEQLSSVVDEAIRLARDDEWAALVAETFDIAEAAPRELRQHALAGACRIGHEVCNRVRNDQSSAGVEAGADRFIARATTLCTSLRDAGAHLEQVVANRIDDFETNVRLIHEARERVAQREAAAAAREVEAAKRAQQLAAAEAAREQAEAQRRAAEELQRRAQAELQARLAASTPAISADPIDDEVLFSSLPVPTLGAYARMFRRLRADSNAVHALAAEGIAIEMLGVINQTWAGLFAKRTDLALRFSVLISTP